MRRCRKCNLVKELHKDFYLSRGLPRTECKACCIKISSKRQARVKPWKYRVIDKDKMKKYMANYYAKNKEKFALYRAKFRAKNPDYYKEYTRRKKNEKY